MKRSHMRCVQPNGIQAAPATLKGSQLRLQPGGTHLGATCSVKKRDTLRPRKGTVTYATISTESCPLLGITFLEPTADVRFCTRNCRHATRLSSRTLYLQIRVVEIHTNHMRLPPQRTVATVGLLVISEILHWFDVIHGATVTTNQ